MIDYKNDYPASRRDNIKETRESNMTGSYNYAARNNPCLETRGPQRKHFKVLHEDGSLADLPDPNVEGAGVGDGTIGR
ncbi:hypothetical protein SNE26_06990 [Mucilaginibacter sp. cycad4]|uniref:hypothetical protein n=1 Tax=Mucilaginibacter sp. cycad4 TaxID=3342096 RepID=UPI002AABA010|nr:hypothetical protein [Mucilaginibacter gossypii]WPV01516.1 hypothetical protein SNE26_06990 [Mucilaginibacter gossypii]